MMSFGWRPDASCYGKVVRPTGCPSPTWWYVLLGLAAVAGLAGRRK